MLNPIVTLLKWHYRKAEKRARLTSEQNFNKGYDWAMDLMVLRTFTYQEVYLMVRNKYDDYHMGALRAVAAFRDLELTAAQKLNDIEKVIQHTS